MTEGMIPHREEYYALLKYEPDALGGYRLQPNQRLPHITINSRGYRGQEFVGDERILILGDSVTFGVGADSDDHVFARYLATSSRLPVADASVRAYRVSQHFAQLPNLLASLPKLDTVILWFGYCDILYWKTSGGCIDGTFQFDQHRNTPMARIMQWINGSARTRQTGTIDELVAYIKPYYDGIRAMVGTKRRFIPLLQPWFRDEQDIEYLVKLQKGLRSSIGFPRDLHSCAQPDDLLDEVHLKQEAMERLAQRVCSLIQYA